MNWAKHCVDEDDFAGNLSSPGMDKSQLITLWPIACKQYVLTVLFLNSLFSLCCCYAIKANTKAAIFLFAGFLITEVTF